MTIKQIYEAAGSLMNFGEKADKIYRKVRENIERLVMVERKYNWKDEASKEFMDEI